MQRGLREYAEYVLARNEMSQYMQVVDPRTEEEKINASDLQSLAQANNELVDYEKGTVIGTHVFYVIKFSFYYETCIMHVITLSLNGNK